MTDYEQAATRIATELRNAAIHWLTENDPTWLGWDRYDGAGIPIDLADDEQLTVLAGAALAALWEQESSS